MHNKKSAAAVETLSVDRLLGAADLLMKAKARGQGAEAFVDAWLGRADTGVGGVSRPYTYDELVEGMCFLIRCGFVEPSSATARDQERRNGAH